MEEGKPSSSSFTSDLFGVKDSSTVSSVLGSIFPPPAKKNEKKNDTVTQALSGKTTVSDLGGQEQSWSTKEKSSYFQEEKAHPFHYNSSIYYGGQDVYFQSSTAQNQVSTTFSKDVGGEDDSSSASRGNWWQGSLYY